MPGELARSIAIVTRTVADGSRRRRSRLLIGLLVLAACVRPRLLEPVGPHSDGTGLTPNHWVLTPAGAQVEVGDRPLGLALAPDGRYLLVSNNGQGIQSLAVVDTQSRTVVQTVPYLSLIHI